MTDARRMRETARKSKRKRDRAEKYLRRCNLKLIENPPNNLESFIVLWNSKRDRKNPGYISFARHCLTNYDSICRSVTSQFGIAVNEDLKEILHDRAIEITDPYLRSIGFFEWYDDRRSKR